MGRETIRAVFRFLQGILIERRRIIQTVLAVLFVSTAVLLVIDQKFALPRPREVFLYKPRGWPGEWEQVLAHGQPRTAQEKGAAPASALGMGGESYSPPPLSIMMYLVKPGDTLEKIASRFGLELDTLSSLNRPGGRGVHNLVVGESIKIPNQDGIHISINGNLQALSDKYNLTPEQVLAVNSTAAESLSRGSRLFFPGAKHEGYDLSLSLGVAIASPLHGWLSSPFGRREDPFTGEPSFHTGIDIAASEGSIVRSASDGYVSSVGYNDILGNYIIVKAPLGFEYVYGHLSAVLVRAGSRISQGAVLGRVGSTGKTTGPHLHFAVSQNGVRQNPRKYMPGL
jgi:murein DD-endopeptidase MepM/ murein hydrolase activator NlpD